MGYAKRKRVSAAVRAHIMYAQDYRCAECSVKLPIGWEVDHRIPLSSERWERFYASSEAATAAANALDNLRGLCANCHARKTFLERDEATAPLLPSPPPDPEPGDGGTRPPSGRTWRASRALRRGTIDRLWLFERPEPDPLTAKLLKPPLWDAVSAADSEPALRRIYRSLPWRATVPFAVFKRRVDHLVSA